MVRKPCIRFYHCYEDILQMEQLRDWFTTSHNCLEARKPAIVGTNCTYTRTFERRMDSSAHYQTPFMTLRWPSKKSNIPVTRYENGLRPVKKSEKSAFEPTFLHRDWHDKTHYAYVLMPCDHIKISRVVIFHWQIFFWGYIHQFNPSWMEYFQTLDESESKCQVPV